MIAIFILYTLPTGASNVIPNVNLPSVENMPPANTSTNVVTNVINNTLNSVSNLFNGSTKKNNGNIFSTVANSLTGVNTSNRRGLNFPFSQV